MATRFAEQMSSMQGAADMVFGFENQRRQWLASDVALEGAKQKIRFNEELHPYDMMLAREKASSDHLKNLSLRMGIWESIQEAQRSSAVDMSLLQSGSDIFRRLNAYLLKQNKGLTAPAGTTGTTGTGTTTGTGSAAAATPNAYALPSGGGGVPGDPMDAIGSGLSDLGKYKEDKAFFDASKGDLLGTMDRDTPLEMPELMGPPKPAALGVNRPQEPPFKADDAAAPQTPAVVTQQTPAAAPDTPAVAPESPAASAQSPAATAGPVGPGAPAAGEGYATATADAPTSLPVETPASEAIAGEAYATGPKDYISGASADLGNAPAPAMTAAAAAQAELEARKAKLDAADQKPEGAQLWDELRAWVQLGGGLENIGKRQPGMIPHLARMFGTLADDPNVQAWKAGQEAKLKRAQNKEQVIGIITSAGLPLSDFEDVLRMADLGIPVSPDMLMKQVESKYKIKEKEAEEKLKRGESLNSYTDDPFVGPFARAGQIIAARGSKEKGDNLRAGVAERLKENDVDGARTLLQQAAIDAAPTAVQNSIEAARGMKQAAAAAQKVLKDFYDTYGKGSTGPAADLSPWNYFKDPKIVSLRNTMDSAKAQYGKAMSGLTLTPSEQERYAKMFPSPTNTKALNDTQIATLVRDLDVNSKAALDTAYAGIIPPGALEGGVTNEDIALMNAVRPKVYATKLAFDRAAMNGEIGDGEGVIVAGKHQFYKPPGTKKK